MQLLVNGRPASLKENSSFDYVSENRAFSDADAYTLSISLPLAGCVENEAIFGHLGRMDCESRRLAYDAVLVDAAVTRAGVLTVVEASESEIKCQFLEGRSSTNFDTTFDDIYINELSLTPAPYAMTMPPSMFLNRSDMVVLPWVNDSADGYLNNEMVIEDGVLKWGDDVRALGKLSFMPYLITVVRAVCSQLGYSCDLSPWELSPERQLLVCNTLPASWDIGNAARALPHWSVTEFFAELEKILVGEFDIDHKARHVAFRFSREIQASREVVAIDDADIVDSFSAEVSYDDDLCEFRGAANICYADRGDELWKFQQCQWFIDLLAQGDDSSLVEFSDREAFDAWCKSFFWSRNSDHFLLRLPRLQYVDRLDKVFHIADTDTYGVFRLLHYFRSMNFYFYEYLWVELNKFGNLIKDPLSDNEISLSCVPARVDGLDSEHGSAVFLAPSHYNESKFLSREDDETELSEDTLPQTLPVEKISEGEPDASPEYYDKIYLAYWPALPADTPASLDALSPAVDDRFSLSRRYADYLAGVRIDTASKLKVSWLATVIPDVRSIFHIRGRRYLCEKITATFTENGMSQLLKGEFYPVEDADD